MTDHDRAMREVYAHIYQDRYAFDPRAMQAVRERIARNLEEFAISRADLARMNVLNVGPSREVMALHEMGARRIFHFDISDLAVDALLRACEGSPAFANIQSVRRDLCSPEPLPVDEGIDFVYLSGIVHHLHDPTRAMDNVIACLNPGAKVYIRIYRSGCMAFFCGDFVRHFIGFEDRDVVDAVFRRLHPEFTPEQKVLYDDLWDNFFVPVQNLFDPAAVHRFFEARGFSVAVPVEIPAYDHDNSSNDGQGVSLYYVLSGAASAGGAPFPRHVDQLADIAYREDYIRRTVELMRAFIERAPQLPPETRAEVAIEVYRHGQLRRMRGPVSAREQHARIQAVLAEHL